MRIEAGRREGAHEISNPFRVGDSSSESDDDISSSKSLAGFVGGDSDVPDPPATRRRGVLDRRNIDIRWGSIDVFSNFIT